MKEIIIPHPNINTDVHRYHSWENLPYRIFCSEILARNNVTPSTHPKAVDIFAGDGSWARMLVEKGWPEDNLVCIDKCRTITPLVPRAQWKYWDLKELGTAIIRGDSLPQGISVLRNQFDIVISVLGFIPTEVDESICEFLVRPGGIIVNQSSRIWRMAI